MDYRLSYMQSVEDSFPNELTASINPCLNLKDAFSEADIVEPSQLKVYLRIRPLLPNEQNLTNEEHVKILNDQSISMIASKNANSHKTNTRVSHNFTFSHVYSADSSQKIIFEQTTEDLVKDVLGGQNCLMFTYGATNSGKTFTIQGTETKPGILPRTLVSLFDSIGSNQYLKENLRPHHFCSVIRLSEEEIRKERQVKDVILRSKDFSRVSACSNFSYASCSSKEFEQPVVNICDNTQASSIFDDTQGKSSTSPCFAVFVSFAEIYNEYVYDLLEAAHKDIKRPALSLGEDKFGSIYIKGLKHIKVYTTEEALQILEVGRQNLHFASTQMNHNSSRSHCIFTIKVVRLFDPSNPQLANTSMLSLCDLAGAERATKTLNSHDRLKEAGNINTSLLVLGRCIAALRHNQVVKHSIGARKAMPVPYRDSKVTRLFQSFFNGKGILAMIVNISPSALLIDETLKVLKFSAIARKVAIVPNRNYMDHAFEKPYARSRFSRFLKRSLNMSKGSIRFSVPWANSTVADVTFGEIEEDTNSTKNETYEEDGCHQALLELVKKLRDRLVAEIKAKQEMENNLRKEICDAFSQRLVEIEASHRCRIEEERSRNDELMDWRVNMALETTDLTLSSRKRQRLEDDLERRNSPLTQFRNEVKCQGFREERDLLLQELHAIKITLKSATQSIQSTQEENSKLSFQMSIISESLEEAEREKEQAKAKLKDALSGSEQAESAVIERQEQKIAQLWKEIETKKEENNTVNLLLAEAADEFIDKEEKLTTTQNALVQQHMVVSDLENQLSEAKQLIACHATGLEEREKTICELEEDIRQSKKAAKLYQLHNPGLDGDVKFISPKVVGKNMQMFKDDFKNQSLIEFENSERKINRQHLQNKEIYRCKYMDETTAIKLEFDATPEKVILPSIDSKENKQFNAEDFQCEMEKLRITNEELLEENATLKFTINNANAESNTLCDKCEKADRLSLSLINNEDLSRCGEAPSDDDAKFEELEDLRQVLESLKLNSISQLEETLLDAQSELKSVTKKLNETDEELVSMCKVNQTLQNEVLSNRNTINEMESRYFGVSSKVTALKKEREELQTYCERLSSQVKDSKQKDVEIIELQSNLFHIKEMNSKLATEAVELREKEAKLVLQVKLYTTQEKEFSEFRIRMDESSQEKTTLQEQKVKLQNDVNSLEKSLNEQNNLVDNLAKKVESLDKKLEENEASNVTEANEKEVLSKQLVAITEARKEEIIKFDAVIIEKENEISILQKEMKDIIIGTKASNQTAESVKQEEDSVHIAEEQLKQSELERSSLASYVSDLKKLLAEKSQSCKDLEAELSKVSFNRNGNSVLAEVDQSQTFEGFVTPVPLPRSKKGRSAPKNRTVQFTESEEEVTETKSKSRAKKGKQPMVTFSDTIETSSLQNSVESSYEETSARRSTRKPRGRGKKNVTLPNPHLPNEKDDKENQRSTTSESKRSTRRRPLYNVNDEQTFDGSPSPTNNTQSSYSDSPHTISKRQLRSKFK